MKINCLMFSFMVLAQITFAQIGFEKGYFINNNNQRIDCLIKNYDQKNSPTEIEYKTSGNAEPQKAGIVSIKEFSIAEYSKFIRVETNIDRSSRELSKLTNKSSPEWSYEMLFLRVLIEGKASLYLYEDQTTYRFFYSSFADTSIRQLIYKEYLSDDDKYLLTNNGFRQQLWNDVRHENASISSVENIQYSESALKKYFNTYNHSNGSATEEFKAKDTKSPLRLKFTSGFTLSSASFSVTDTPYKNTEFGKGIDYRLGIEGEYILPVNKSKWSIVLEPSYQHYSSKSENYLGDAEIEYQSLEFPLGLRYYVFINEKLNMFTNAFYVFNSGLNFDSAITFYYQGAKPIIIDTKSCLAFGIGVNYKRLSSEIRINSTRNIVSRYTYHSEYQVTSFIIGFRIF